MNKEAGAQWADALQFEDIDQGFGSLIEWKKDDPENFGFCGLGVACKVYADLVGQDLHEVLSERSPEYGLLPIPVAIWLDITTDQQNEIVHLNDAAEKSLPEIGAWVRDHWVKDE